MITAEQLRDAGLLGRAAEHVASLFERATSALDIMTWSSVVPSAFWVPGRIEFLGKHTDYAGGRSLICAVDRGIALVSRPRADATVRVHDALRGETVTIALDEHGPAHTGHWGAYADVVARRIARNFPGARTGADISFASNLPPAAGMSSSSALIISVFMALEASNSLECRGDFRRAVPSMESLAGYLGSIESGSDFGELTGDRGIGTMSGSQDQTAILCGRADALVRYSFCPVRAEGVVPLPDDHRFIIASSGVLAEKNAGAQARYNAVALRAGAAVATWNEHTGRNDRTLGDALASGLGAADRIRAVLRDAPPGQFAPNELLERFEQFVAEAEEIIPATARALEDGDLARVGELVAQSQAGAEQRLGNQVDETKWLVEDVRDEAVAASAFGAGFGGSVWALVSSLDAERIKEEWRARYLAKYPQHAARAEFFVTWAGPPAKRLA